MEFGRRKGEVGKSSKPEGKEDEKSRRWEGEKFRGCEGGTLRRQLIADSSSLIAKSIKGDKRLKVENKKMRKVKKIEGGKAENAKKL